MGFGLFDWARNKDSTHSWLVFMVLYYHYLAGSILICCDK
jgi:hypothetical protein